MKKLPRLYLPFDIEEDFLIPASLDNTHYLLDVMRTNSCLVFNKESEFLATLVEKNKKYYFSILEKTTHQDPSNEINLYFAPVKRIDELVNIATQLGVSRLCPVITDRTVIKNINFDRLKKISIEASEQSGRNSIPLILETIPFRNLNKSNLSYADERKLISSEKKLNINSNNLLIGPEGGFSENEFSILDNSGAIGFSLGKTILRSEIATAVAISKFL